MLSLLLLLLCLADTLHAQIAPRDNKNLATLYQEGAYGLSAEQKAMEYLLLSYPELGGSTNVTISKIGREKNPFNLKDVYFTLYMNETRTSVIATISQAEPGAFISISPLVTTQGSPDGSAGLSFRSRSDSNFYIISGGQIKIINSVNNSERLVVPGGYQAFVNSSDVRLERAEGLLASLHPHMVNYSPQQVDYQVVSGMKFNIRYLGKDGITAATALLRVNLDMEPYLLGFQVACASSNPAQMIIPCTDELANQIFSACESLLLLRPELLSYEMVSVVSDDFQPKNGLLFVLTYENKKEKTRVMAQLNIQGNIFSLMSYYAYAYPVN